MKMILLLGLLLVTACGDLMAPVEDDCQTELHQLICNDYDNPNCSRADTINVQMTVCMETTTSQLPLIQQHEVKGRE